MRIQKSFYTRTNVVEVAQDLLGKILITRQNGLVTKGIIVEVEAYSQTEKACHAYNQRKTERTSIMFGEGGHAYVYLVYGIHYLFNIVTNSKNSADAVLIRALEPVEGIDIMLKRRKMSKIEKRLTSGPGALSKAMGIDIGMYGLSLNGNVVWLEHNKRNILPSDIVAAKRVGVDYAGKDALLPWRFYLKESEWVSRI